jgi:hypothetical protein
MSGAGIFLDKCICTKEGENVELFAVLFVFIRIECVRTKRRRSSIPISWKFF